MTDFIKMTNDCEAKGFLLRLIRTEKGITCELYKHSKLVKKGTKVFNTSIDAQAEVFTKLYLMINK